MEFVGFVFFSLLDLDQGFMGLAINKSVDEISQKAHLLF